jgi:hypothetical protein
MYSPSPHSPFPLVAKKASSVVVELVEGEHDVINLGKVEASMGSAVQALKHEYTTSVTARITPGGY